MIATVEVRDPGSEDRIAVSVDTATRAVVRIARGDEELGAYPFPVDERAVVDSAVKQDRIAAQFPKRCGCGLVHWPEWVSRSRLAWINAMVGQLAKHGIWNDLQHAYNVTDEYATQEARHCPCGSTLVVLTQIHDLAAE